jgi:MFS family permease
MPRHFLLLILCILAYSCAGTVSMLMSVYLPAVVRDLLGSADEATMSRVGPWLNAAYLAGMTVGGLLLGYLSDRFGRVRMLTISAVVCGVFTLAVVSAHDWVWLAMARAVAGMGVAGILVTCAVLVSERWPAKSCAVAQGILGVAFPVGIVLSGGLNVIFSDWREAFLVGFAPILVAVLVLFLLKEEKTAATEKVDQSPLKALFQPQNRQKLFTGAVVNGFDLVGLWAIFSWMPTWVDSLLGGGESAGEMRGITMMLLGMGGMVGTGLSGLLINRLGVRRTLLSNFIGTLVVCALLFLSNHDFSPLVLFETAVLALFFGISQGALTVYITELFPTEVRATGSGFCFNIGRVFTTSAVFFVGSLVAALGGYATAMLVFSGAFVVAWVALFFDRSLNPKLSQP